MPAEDWSENVYIVHLADDPAFSEELESLIRQSADDPRHAVLDMGAVTFLNSSNLSQLLRLRQAIGPAGWRIILAAVSRDVWNTFVVAGLDKLFKVSEGVPLALAELQLSEAPTNE